MACDNTAPDAGLTDTCISIAHGALPQWWLSPAITLNNASAGATANPSGTNNTTDVTFHYAADCKPPAGTSGVVVGVYVCVPGLAMNPADASKVKLLGTAFIPQAPAGADTSLLGTGKAIIWQAGTDPTKPDGPGHKCLVAVASWDFRNTGSGLLPSGRRSGSRRSALRPAQHRDRAGCHACRAAMDVQDLYDQSGPGGGRAGAVARRGRYCSAPGCHGHIAPGPESHSRIQACGQAPTAKFCIAVARLSERRHPGQYAVEPAFKDHGSFQIRLQS